MPNPKGNPGNKGGGRKSAYQEYEDAERLLNLVYKKYSREDLRRLTADDKHKMDIFERMVIMAHLGKERIAIAIFNKIFPDRIELESCQERDAIEIRRQQLKEIFDSVKNRTT